MNVQPLHLDEEFSKGTIHGQRVVNSLFTVALIGAFHVPELTMGTTLGNLGYDSIKFPHPVFHGDTLRGETTIVNKRESSQPDRLGDRLVPPRRHQPARRGRRRHDPGRPHGEADHDPNALAKETIMTATTTAQHPLRDWVPATRTLLIGDRDGGARGRHLGRVQPGHRGGHRDRRRRVRPTRSTRRSMAARAAFPTWAALSGEERVAAHPPLRRRARGGRRPAAPVDRQRGRYAGLPGGVPPGQDGGRRAPALGGRGGQGRPDDAPRRLRQAAPDAERRRATSRSAWSPRSPGTTTR